MASFQRSAPFSTASGFYTVGQQPSPIPSMSSSMRVLIAIDFGTTHSAVAWTIHNKGRKGASDLHVIQRWPEKSNTFDKVPTLLHYDHGASSPSWGFPVCDQDRRYEWFKLEQDPKYRGNLLRRNYPDTAIPPDSLGEVENLITDYLKLIRSHAEDQIRKYHVGKPPGFLNIPWEYVITVPAMWQEPAQNVTLRSAQSAGMALAAPIKIIAEPEAAGMYGLSTVPSDERKENDTFMICDAGGGTVDLISYTITRNGSSPRVSEASPGTGGLCGSSFLDRGFNAWLSKHFKYFSDWTPYHQADAVEKWEREVKRDFKGDDKARYVFKAAGMKDNPSLGVQRGKLIVMGSTVKEIFNPVVTEILRLVQGQLSTVLRNGSRVKTIFMAGGFGNSDYLEAKIAQMVGNNIKVQKMENCETAIVRGALMRSLADQQPNVPHSWPTIETKRAKKHYGISVLAPFNPREHDGSQPLVPGGIDGGQRVYIMKWFIEKNKMYRDGEPQHFEFFLDEREDDVQRNGGHLSNVTLDIYTCAHDQAPIHPDTPYYQAKCSKIARLPTKLNLIPISELKTELAKDGYIWYFVPFKISMIRDLEVVRFELVFTPSNGQSRTIASVDAEWIST